MKFLFTAAFAFSLSLTAHADLIGKLTRVDTKSAAITIQTDDKESVQAAQFVDGSQNSEFIQMLLADPKSDLSLLKAKIEKDNCGESLDGCGAVEVTSSVQTSFERGGWQASVAGYTFFIGFRDVGTGHYFASTHMVLISEESAANIDKDDQYTGSVTKILTLEQIAPIPGLSGSKVD